MNHCAEGWSWSVVFAIISAICMFAAMYFRAKNRAYDLALEFKDARIDRLHERVTFWKKAHQDAVETDSRKCEIMRAALVRLSSPCSFPCSIARQALKDEQFEGEDE